jgi:hypothetical protein
MTKWVDRDWYRYVWRRKLSFETQAFLVVLAVGVVLVGGFLAADQFASASGTSSGAYILRSTTVTRIVTATKNGKTVVRRYPIVHTVRIKARPVTVQNFQTVTTSGGTKVVPVTTVKYVSVNKVVTNVVTKKGGTTTLVETRPVTVESTVATTVAQTQTQLQTVTNERTNTVVTTKPVTTTSTVVQASTVVQTTTRVTTAVQTVTNTTTRTVTTLVTVPITITVKLP